MAGKIRLIGAVGIKVRPDTTEFKKELREQIKNLPDYDIEVNVDADTTIMKRKIEKAKADAEKNSIKLKIDEDVYDDLKQAQATIKKAIASLSQQEITVGLNSKELEAKLANLQRKARGASVTMEFNEDKAGYEAVLAKIRAIKREKMVKEISFKTDNKSLAAEARKYEQLLADLAPAKTITITHRNDHESLNKAVATIDEALAKLKEVTLTPEMDEAKLLAQKASLQKKLAAKPLVMKVTEDKNSWDAVLKKITDLQETAAATEFKFKTDEQGLIAAAAKVRAKIAELTPKPQITFAYENDTRGMNGALAEIERRLAEMSRIKLVADLDEEGLKKARDELESQLSTSSFGISVDSGDLDALKAERKKLEEMMAVNAIQDIQITVENTPESMEKAKAELDELIKQREAPIKASPLTFEAMAELAYASRARDVPFYVRINQRSLAIAEGVLQSLAGINVLQSTGRQLETLVTNFDRISIKTGALSALVGGLADTFIYLTTALFPVGEGILHTVGLLAMAPAALSALTATAVINIAAWQDFGDAVDGSAEALAKLPRQAQDTVLALRGSWTEMQEPIQDNFWAGMGDSMRSAVEAFLPIVTKGLSGAAEHVGRFAAGVFRSLEKVSLSGDLDTMFTNLELMFDNAAGAAEPLVDAINRIGLRGSEYLPRLGQWVTDIANRFDAWIKKADEAGQINVWIEQGVQSLKDMWLLGGGIAKMFQAIGTAAKEAGAGGLGDVAKRFDEIGTMMNQEPFRTRLSTIFEGGRKGASELNVGVKELGATLGEASLFVADLLQQLGRLGGGALVGLSSMLSNLKFQTGILDSLTGLNTMVRQLDSGFYDLGTVIGNLASIAGASFTSIGPVINQVIGLLATITGTLGPELMNTIPTLMTLVGGFISTLTGPAELIATTLANVLAWVNGLGGPMSSLLIAFASFVLLAGKIGPIFQAKPGGFLEKIMYDFQQADGARNKFTTGLKGIGAGMLGALGGPWGIAVGLAVTGLSMMGQNAAETKAQVDSLTATLDANTGAITKNTTATIAKALVDHSNDGFYLFENGAKSATETLGALGRSVQDTAAIVAAGGEPYDKMIGLLREGETALAAAGTSFDENGFAVQGNGDALDAWAKKMGISKDAVSQLDLTDLIGQLEKQRGATDRATGGWGLMNDGIDKTTPRVRDFNTAMQAYNDTTGTADSRTRALKAALDILSGKQPSVEEAQLKVNDALRAAGGELSNVNGQMIMTGGVFRDAEGNLLNFNGVIDATTGKIDTAGTAGANLYRNLQTATGGVLETATAMKDAGKPIGDITKFLDDSRTAYINQGVQAGLSAEVVAKAYDYMIGANPKDLVTTITAQGVEDAKTKLRDYKGNLEEIDAYHAVAKIMGDDVVLGVKLADSYTKLSAFDATVATATAGLDPTQADTVRQRILNDLINLAKTDPTVAARMDPALLDREREAVIRRLEELGRMKPTPEVKAQTEDAKTQLGIIQGLLNPFNNKTYSFSVIAKYTSSGTPVDLSSMDRQMLHGGILDGAGVQKFANGGFWGGRPVKTFATGGVENHVAQIARGATPYRVWAEPETGGEAYIPLSSAKRGRSTQILEQVAKQFGYSLTKAQTFADGGVVNGGNARATAGLQVHIDTFNQNANDTIEDVGRGIMRQVRTAGLTGIMDGI